MRGGLNIYNCHLSFYLTGSPCRVFDLIKQIPPMDCFSHEFSESESPDSDSAAKADVIFFNYNNNPDGKEILEYLIETKNKNAQLILISQKENISYVSGLFSEITDIWTAPMPDDEIKFRFSRWQQTYKMSKDYWQTSQFLETTINSIPNMIWYKDKEGIHEKVNDCFCRTVNKPRKQVEGKDHFYIWNVDPDDPASNGHDCMESDLEVIRSEKTCVAEETVMSGDEMKLFTTYKSPLYNLDGTVMGTVGIGIDITQERAYEQEIVKKNHVLEAIFASVDCGILCHSMDGKQIINVNRTALNILGYKSYDELTEDFDMVAESVEDEDKPKLRSAIKTLKNEGDSVSTEYRVKHSDGRIIHVMGNIKLLKENGEFFYQRFLLDCTEQKRQEQENKRRQMEMIQALSIDYNHIFFLDIDDNTCTPLRSDSRMTSFIIDEGLSYKDNVSRYINMLVIDEDREMMQNFLSVDFLKKEFSLKDLLYADFRVVMDGEIEYHEVKAVKVGTWKRHHRVVIGFRSVDEETRHKMEQKRLLETALVQANSANKAKSVFLSNMSHDMRTPMNAIMGFTNLAVSRIDDREKVKDYLYKIMSSGNHLLSLINNVLDISQIESGKLQLEETLCSLPEFFEEVKNIVYADIQEKRLDFSIETNILNKEIYCDKLQLNRIFVNIINNSIKYTDSGGKISLKITEKNNAPEGHANYEFIIKDSGIGMSRDFVEHIFELFSRERNTTNSGIQGTGLGMAITKNIVDIMNGSIDVKSEQGAGTEVDVNLTFRLYPENISGNIIQPAAEEIQPDIANIMKKSDKSVKARVLLVEDNELNQEIASEILEEIGFESEIAENGKIAVEMLSESEPDYYKIVLMDIQMPVMNGYEATKAIRRLDNRKLASIPIIAITANAFAEDQQEALNCGMNEHLSKPIDARKLLETLNKYYIQ